MWVVRNEKLKEIEECYTYSEAINFMIKNKIIGSLFYRTYINGITSIKYDYNVDKIIVNKIIELIEDVLELKNIIDEKTSSDLSKLKQSIESRISMELRIKASQFKEYWCEVGWSIGHLNLIKNTLEKIKHNKLEYLIEKADSIITFIVLTLDKERVDCIG